MLTNIKALTGWLWAGIFLVSLMVAIGGITRLTGSGLSIVHWNVVTGIIPPISETQWEGAFEDYKKFPEYQKINSTISLEGFKKIFWWEYVHRLIGRITGIVFIVPFIFFLIKKNLSPSLVKKLTFILLLGLMQGIMGWVMVKSGLHDNPHVSHYRLAAHLTLALLLIGSILWLILEINLKEQIKNLQQRNARLVLQLLCVAFLFIQIILGAFVAGLKAGFSYNTFPLMEDKFLPAHTFHSSTRMFDNGVLIQFAHRWFAWIVAATVFILWFKIRRDDVCKNLQFYTNLLLLAVILQMITGIVTLVWRVPLVLGVLHQMLAVVLFALLITVLFYMKWSCTKVHSKA